MVEATQTLEATEEPVEVLVVILVIDFTELSPRTIAWATEVGLHGVVGILTFCVARVALVIELDIAVLAGTTQDEALRTRTQVKLCSRRARAESSKRVNTEAGVTTSSSQRWVSPCPAEPNHDFPFPTWPSTTAIARSSRACPCSSTPPSATASWARTDRASPPCCKHPVAERRAASERRRLDAAKRAKLGVLKPGPLPVRGHPYPGRGDDGQHASSGRPWPRRSSILAAGRGALRRRPLRRARGS